MAVATAAGGPSRHPCGAVRVAEVMTRPPRPLAPATPLAEATGLLRAAPGGRLPVVAAGGLPVGTLGRAELLDACQRGLAGHTPVGEVMVPFLLAVPREAPLSQAVALMAFEGVRCLGVLDGRRHLVGMVGALDVLAWLGGADLPGA